MGTFKLLMSIKVFSARLAGGDRLTYVTLLWMHARSSELVNKYKTIKTK